MFTKLTRVGDVIVRDEILKKDFCCDLDACKGACCTMESAYGAPVTKEEIETIDSILEDVLPYLPEEHVAEIKTKGFHELKEGELLLCSLNNQACLFVRYEDGIAKCGIERAFFDGKVAFRKPISCHLFPIRVSKFGGDVLRYERFGECEPALENGKKLKVRMVDFCRDSLVRSYGESWFKELKEKKEE